MNNKDTDIKLANNHISVDCVVIGFDGDALRVLLIHRQGEDHGESYHDMKLPGSLIYEDEDLDQAASRVLNELTRLKNVDLIQFRAYGSKDRTKDPRDVLWLERAQRTHVERIVTVAYLALVKIDRPLNKQMAGYNAEWVAVNEVPDLAFDHNMIVRESVEHIRMVMDHDSSRLFTLLPRKFTASQLRILLEVIAGHPIDARNFHKKLAQMDYVVPLEERQTGVAHRAARYYKFDRKIYNKTRQ